MDSKQHEKKVDGLVGDGKGRAVHIMLLVID